MSDFHVAIVLDGNRRYAKKNRWKNVWGGHEIGFNKIEELLNWCQELGINELTLYCFSTENFNRDKLEIKFLFDLFRKRIDGWIKDARIHQNKVRVKVIGRLNMFPKDMQTKMNKIMDDTKEYDKFQLNLCMAYGGRQEIVDAMKKIVERGVNLDSINEKMLSENMYGITDPDIIIRPGGEKRMSNFLTWGSVYSEVFFLTCLWPEFTKENLVKVLDEYKERERRFGK